MVVLSARAVRLSGAVPVPACGVGVVFGNRIADASIFACLALWGGACLLGVCRAFGGCLGIKGRRRTWQSAISLGELASER